MSKRLCLIYFFVLGLVLLASASVQAKPPQVQLSADDLVSEWVKPFNLPSSDKPDPDAWWQQAQGQSGALQDPWSVRPGLRTISAVTLKSAKGQHTYVLQVPNARLDGVLLFWRTPGKDWQEAQAGDTVPLRQWPFKGQFPAFSLDFFGQELDVLVALNNSNALETPVWIMSNASYHERRLYQANATGLISGVLLMVVIVCLASALTIRRAASWAVVIYSMMMLATYLVTNGYAAIWFTPDWPYFNDSFKHFIAMLASASLVGAVVFGQDARLHIRWQRWLPAVFMVLGLLLGFLQLWVLPWAWRTGTGYSWIFTCVAVCLLLCAQVRLLGARWVWLGFWASMAFGAAALTNLMPRIFLYGLDLQGATAASFLAVSGLLLLQSQQVQYRYGRDVLGRETLQKGRDPLTALHSFEGFRDCFDEVVLRQQVSSVPGWLLVVELRGIDQSTGEYGVVTSEQLIVRVAAILHRELAEHWQVARIGHAQFAAVSSYAYSRDVIRVKLTSILTEAIRYPNPLSWVDRVDLRLVGTKRLFETSDIIELLSQMGKTIQELPDKKRISVA
jgi:two-component system, sensor histidine kinase LadS